jgi:hypothetical protein
MIKVTENQNRYLLLLEEEPRTTNDFMRELTVTMEAAGRMMRKLKSVGLVKSKKTKGRGNPQEHSLTKPYAEIVEKGLSIRAKATGPLVTDQEVRYAAELRNAGMTGQELTAQHRKVYPDRAMNGVSNVVDKARKKGLCR